MASNSYRGGSSFYNGDAAPYRSREGLSTRPAAASDEIQLQIDPMQGDLDDQIVGLHGQVKRLRNIAQEIGTEAKSQQDFLDQLQMTLIKAQAGVKNNVRRLNKKIIQNGSNHVVQVVVFALICFFIVYMWSKISRK
ncbi:Bet1-like protein [Cucurbita argyrosperma subsp. argyrosperma]|uniref:Bet1-like protein At1g29060 n=1 Tax=Cucurbita moschata TaxID=3662 RepID=A0A6J1FQQ6_CUCMO|nr:bet1-like protein At1g29060 [Cucurbita moschata]KAG7037611.1 Bet1-like protein [Cucurbita argyrosperma subsp. argyrosperma]